MWDDKRVLEIGAVSVCHASELYVLIIVCFNNILCYVYFTMNF